MESSLLLQEEIIYPSELKFVLGNSERVKNESFQHLRNQRHGPFHQTMQ